LFARDKDDTGTSKFWILASVPAWTKHIFSLPANNRPGHCVVCPDDGKLFGFMDLEYYTEYNPDRNVTEMLSSIIRYYNKAWTMHFPHTNMNITMDSFLVLCASSEKKVSFHIHGPFEYAFPDKRHLTLFMSSVHEQLVKEKICMVRKEMYKKSITESFLDMMPYKSTGECCFRLYACTKEDRVLQVYDNQLDRLKITNSAFTPLQDVTDIVKIDQFLLEKSIVHAVPSDTPLVSMNESLIPKKKKKIEPPKNRSFFLLKETKANDITTATHFEKMDDGNQYRIIKPQAYHYLCTCMEKAMNNRKEFYNMYEIMTDTTVLLLQVNSLEHLTKIQQLVHNRYSTHNLSCFCVQVGENLYQLVWPDIHVDRDRTGPEVTRYIKNELGDIVHDGIYERQFVHCIGSSQMYIEDDEKKYFKNIFIGEFDLQGEKIDNKDILSVLKLVTVRLEK
jgi:hypothetical protein